MGHLAFALLLAAVAVLLVAGIRLRERYPVAVWYIAGYPVTALRIAWHWREVARHTDLAVAPGPVRTLIADVVVTGRPLRPVAPRISFPKPTRTGVSMLVRLHPGQTPEHYKAVVEALAHAWRVHAVRVTSPDRGFVLLTATAVDPLQRPGLAHAKPALLSALVGILEAGGAWVINLRTVPHWMIVGATQSGKSTLLARLVAQFAPQHVALVGIDCKGGMELGLFECRLSALATSRREAVAALGALAVEMQERTVVCREAGVRSIWQLPEKLRPVPVVVIVDEIAELYLHDGSRDSKAEAEQCSVYLLRIAQLGAALGLHLVVAGQRIGSELGSGVTALRAQLSGRICHRVNDGGTAEMTLGDLAKDAVAAAQSITEEEKGVAVCLSAEGGWSRARSHLTTIDQARESAAKHSHLTPVLPGVHRALLMADGDGAS